MNKKKMTTLQGMIKRHPDGFGFFIPDDRDHPDVYVPRHSMTGVMTNDKVMITVEPEKGGGRFRGEIIKILERGTKKIVGKFQPLPNGGGIVRDEGKGWGQDLRIKPEDTLQAKPDELVAIEILAFPDEGVEFRGKVVQVIGSSTDPLNDIERVVQGLNIPSEFSKQAIAEASRISAEVSEDDMKGRKNLRKLKFVTIDGATAKDFDDAIFVENNKKGFRLYVAIADVSHYVRPGTAIDRDAIERGTSCYFPNFVIPMLPEILSNELCSLNPHRPRLALVAEMQLDFTGTMNESDFYEAVIESHARVTYGEAQELVDGNEVEKLNHVKDDILRASDLAKILMARRFREGSLDLEIPETQLMIDAGGNPIDIIRSERLFAHRLIEEMMLAANVAVATFLSSKEIPAIYRIHEPPNTDAISLLEKYLKTFGGQVQLGEGKLQKRLTKALQEFEGKPEAQVLNILTLRSMSQAKYSHNNVGHFGLGFEFYTHFTSPIRRYPDLLVHRLIKSLVMPRSSYKAIPEDELATAGTMLSACEQRAVKAERQIQSIKKARFMEKHVGEDFDGIISSVTKFGIFVLLRQFEIDGLVHLENLNSRFDRFEFDDANLRLVATRSGFAYSIGDAVRVRVASADHIEGKIDFALADRLEDRISNDGKSAPTDRSRPRMDYGSGQQERRSGPNDRREKRPKPEHHTRSRGRKAQELALTEKKPGAATASSGPQKQGRLADKRKPVQKEFEASRGPRSDRGPRKGPRSEQESRPSQSGNESRNSNRPGPRAAQKNSRPALPPERPQVSPKEKTAPTSRAGKFFRGITNAFRGLTEDSETSANSTKNQPERSDRKERTGQKEQPEQDNKSTPFDPGKKLEEAIRRRGLNPTTSISESIRGPGDRKIGFGLQKQEQEKRGRRHDDRPGQPKDNQNSGEPRKPKASFKEKEKDKDETTRKSSRSSRGRRSTRNNR